MTGRPTKCTPEVTAKVCEALKLGVTWEAAAAHAECHVASLMDWLKRGKEGEQPFTDFLDETTRARDSSEVRMAALVLKAAQSGNIVAAMWWLERRRPAAWGRTPEVATVVNVSQGPSELAAFLSQLTKE